jgi:hypothetical protein
MSADLENLTGAKRSDESEERLAVAGIDSSAPLARTGLAEYPLGVFHAQEGQGVVKEPCETRPAHGPEARHIELLTRHRRELLPVPDEEPSSAQALR